MLMFMKALYFIFSTALDTMWSNTVFIHFVLRKLIKWFFFRTGFTDSTHPNAIAKATAVPAGSTCKLV
jgi:hypothetical protein